LLRVFELLRQPAVLLAGALQVALRRLVFAGARTQTEDRLIDLIICSEALFIHHVGNTSRQSQSATIAAAAERLLGSDPDLGVAPGDVQSFMSAAYRRRNAEVHGDPRQQVPLVDLRGDPAANLEAMVDDLDRLMRRACQLILDRASHNS
jgi:hypothetical protein